MAYLQEDALYEDLTQWVSKLCHQEITTTERFGDGEIFAQALHTIDSGYFDDRWLSKFSGSDGSGDSAPEAQPNSDGLNWRVRASRLRKILQKVTEYYEESLGRAVPMEWRPDVNAIAGKSSKKDIAHLLQLLLGIAVFCDRKQDFIQQILSLSESVQHSVMQAINEVQTRTQAGSPVAESNTTALATSEEMESLKEKCSELQRRCFQLDSQVASLVEERAGLQTENGRLVSRLASASVEADVSSGDGQPGSPAGRRLALMQTQIDRMQNDLLVAEAANDDLHAKLDTMLRENEELKARVDELVSVEHNYRTLKDEAEELRSKVIIAKKTEATLETYRRKMKEQSDMRAEMKILEEKNENYMKSAIELEEEQRKNVTLKTQLEAQRRQAAELQSRLDAEVRRADKADFERKRLADKLHDVEQQLSGVTQDVVYWKEYADELKTAQETAGLGESASDGGTPRSLQENGIITSAGSATELRSQVVRLEAANDLLREKASTSEQLDVYKSELDAANARNQELQTENRIVNQKLLETEGRLEDLTAQRESDADGDDARLRQKHADAEKLQTQLEQTRTLLETNTKFCADKEALVVDLQSRLDSREVELRDLNTKFKNYMEKSRTVICGLERTNSGTNRSLSGSAATSDVVAGAGGAQEFEGLRKELETKDRQLQRLQEELDKAHLMQEQEQRLITTGFYQMALQSQQSASRERLSGRDGSAAQSSFLSKQRQIVSPRQQQLNNQQSSSIFSSSLMPRRLSRLLLVSISLLALLLVGSWDTVMASTRIQLSHSVPPPF